MGLIYTLTSLVIRLSGNPLSSRAVMLPEFVPPGIRQAMSRFALPHAAIASSLLQSVNAGSLRRITPISLNSGPKLQCKRAVNRMTRPARGLWLAWKTTTQLRQRGTLRTWLAKPRAQKWVRSGSGGNRRQRRS